jgi:hypothetical protein
MVRVHSLDLLRDRLSEGRVGGGVEVDAVKRTYRDDGGRVEKVHLLQRRYSPA